MYIHVHTCTYMYIHVHTCTYSTYMYIHVHTCMYMYVHTCTYMYIHVHTFIAHTYNSAFLYRIQRMKLLVVIAYFPYTFTHRMVTSGGHSVHAQEVPPNTIIISFSNISYTCTT